MARGTNPEPAGGKLIEYLGRTRLVVRGPVSGRIYRFARPYAAVLVEERDAPYLLAVPNLRAHGPEELK